MIRHSNFVIRISALLLTLTTLACKVTPDYKSPPLQIPTAYKSPQDSTTINALGTNWWVLFQDPQLTLLEEAATQHNPDLQAAMERVRQAREAARAVQSQFFPVVNFTPSATRTRSPQLNRSGNVSSAGSSGGTTSTLYQIPLDLSYEVDLWGRIARGYESAKAQAQAAAYAYFVVQQTLHSDVAVNYFTLRSLDAQSRILAENVTLYRDQLALVKKQFNAGFGVPSSVPQVQALLSATESQEIDIRRQRADVEHALAILTGRPPSELELAINPLTNPPPTIPAGLPIDLLRRRPDVAQAEELLRAANADIGVAQADFLPRLTLTGAAGFESLDLGHAVNWQSRVFSFGPSLSVPIFEGGRLTAQLRQAQSRYAETLANYRSTILSALRDVEDSLTDLSFRAQQAAAQRQAVEASQEYLRLAIIQRDKGGNLSPLELIDADRTVLTNQLNEAQILNQRLTATILLIKALGGGWQSPAPVTSNQPMTTLPDHSPSAPPDAPVPPIPTLQPPETQPATRPDLPTTEPATASSPPTPGTINRSPRPR